MERSDRLALTYVMAAQSQKHVTVNETTRALDALVHMSVRSQAILDEPNSPVPGDGYILPPGKTGTVWSTFLDHAVVMFQDNAWMQYPPVEGMTVYVKDTGGHIVWNGTAWTSVAGGSATSAPSFGVNASADTTNKLAVKSDAVLFTHDDVTPGSGDMRAVVNKASEADTASLVFQDGFSARAEFGLTGTNDLVIKVSPDGQIFLDALIVDRTTGSVRFPNTSSFNGDDSGDDNGDDNDVPPFSPTDLSDLAAWWDPSDAVTVSSGNGSLVASLADKSGNNVDAVQDQLALQPTLLESGIGDRDVLSFVDGSFLDCSGVSEVFSGQDNPFSVHFIFQSRQTTSTQIPFGVGNSSSGGYGYWFGVHSTGAFRVSKRSRVAVNVNATASDMMGHVVSISHDGSTTTLWVDGVRVVEAVSQDVDTMPVDRVSLGAWLRATVDFPFDGMIGEVLIYDRALTDPETRKMQRYLGDRWFGLPASADLFLAMGQSNMMGKGDASLSPDVSTGHGFEWSSANIFQMMSDPVGAADSGSCFPAFANAWHTSTGNAAFVVNAALGSTSLLPEADAGFGNWGKSTGTLYRKAIVSANFAIAAVSNGSIFSLSGVHALWAQGERDAENIVSGTPGVSSSTYQAALNTLIFDTQADISVALTGFYIFELGARKDGAGEAGWASLRVAQGKAAEASNVAHIVFTGAKNFADAGLMADNVHYSQVGYNQMGTVGGTFAAGLLS